MSTTIPAGKAIYKKKEGIITLTQDQKSLTWAPLPGTGPPHVSLAVDKIKNLQQTPATAAKVILKIFEKPRSPNAESSSYLFQFNSPADARAECNAIRDILTTLMPRDPNAPKPAGEAAPKPDANGSADSASMSFANAVNAPKAAVMRWFDDEMLLGDGELHQSLMKRDESLSQTYTDARAAKPEFISDAAFDKQFWSTRIGLLRAHAIELNQKKGQYNVLSTIKPRVENDELKLSINVDQVQLIFQQHPVVKRVYNENVPKLNDAQFWSQFFLSRLYKKLRGERITDNDDTNPIFDRYLDADATVAWASTITPDQIPHIIDLEANEENKGGFKGGNRSDAEMRPRANVPIIKALNSISSKIMAGVQATDSDIASSSAGPDALPRDTDASTFAHLDIRNLHDPAAANQIPLNVKKQDQSFSNQTAAQSFDTLADAATADQSPDDVLFLVSADLETIDLDPTTGGAGGIDLHRSIGIDDDSESDTGEGLPPKHPHPASRAALKTAQHQILEGMAMNRSGPATTTSDASSPNAIPPAIAERCALTNATTTEFLRQFWAAFYSGDAARAQELAYHEEALARCQARVRALAEEAEAAKAQRAEQRKREMKEIFRRTGRKTPWVKVGGGRDAVMAFLGGQMEALEHARGLYRKAVEGV